MVVIPGMIVYTQVVYFTYSYVYCYFVNLNHYTSYVYKSFNSSFLKQL